VIRCWSSSSQARRRIRREEGEEEEERRGGGEGRRRRRRTSGNTFDAHKELEVARKYVLILYRGQYYNNVLQT
jgi:hypothetical protein